MTSLDKALMKVYESGSAPAKRRSVDSEQSHPRELYVDPATVGPPDPSLELAATEPMTEDTASDTEIPPLLSTGDIGAPLDSFIVQQQFEIPTIDQMLDEASVQPAMEEPVELPVAKEEPAELPVAKEEPVEIPVATEEPAEMPEAGTTTASAPFVPAWEVDAFRLTQPCQLITEQFGERLVSAMAQLRSRTADGKKIVSIHSAIRGEGKTTLAVSLAVGLAQTGSNVLVVDADCINPALSHSLDLAVEHGWEAAITGEIPVSECCIRSNDSFTVMPLTAAASQMDAEDLYDALRVILAELESSFDIVLIDVPAGTARIAEIDEMTACRVAVRDVRRTNDLALSQLVESLKQQTCQTVETVDNFA